jgi:hypothetical protein
VQHKRRGRPRLKDSTPSTGSLHSEHRRPSHLNRPVSDDSWKSQSSPYARESLRREYQHHNRSFSQGSQPGPRHHPYGNPTAPTSAVPMRSIRNTSGYSDLPSPSSAAPAYNTYPAPNSPNYYSYSNSQKAGPHSKEPMAAPHSPYQSSPAARPDTQYSGPATRSQPLLPFPESNPRRGSFPSNLRQSEPGQYAHRTALLRTGSGSAVERHRHEQGGDPEPKDSVKLPSLKDLGVPFR